MVHAVYFGWNPDDLISFYDKGEGKPSKGAKGCSYKSYPSTLSHKDTKNASLAHAHSLKDPTLSGPVSDHHH